MHVAGSVITSGVVSNYLAAEIEGSTDRGYAPNDLIPIYRDPAELEKALDSFRDIPLLRRHIWVSADEPQKDDIVGVVTNPSLDGGDMVANLTFWSAADGIDPVESEEKVELSCGYLRDIDWTPGEVDGLQYAARFFNIRGNHVAIVSRGRVTGARVADELPVELSMSDKLKFPRIIAALQTALGLKPEQALAVDSALVAELPEAPAPVVEKTAEQLAAEATEKTAADEAEKKARENEVKAAVDAAVAATHALYAAREAVAEKVGVTSLDSAEATYRFALEKTGASHAGVAADALPALWQATVKVPEGSAKDSAFDLPELDINKLFSVSHIRKG